jgi:hypothetical protein
MPKIRKGDTEKSWIPMCINYVMKNEGLDAKQSAGKCYGMWRQHQKNKRAKSQELHDEAITEAIKKTVDDIIKN